MIISSRHDKYMDGVILEIKLNKYMRYSFTLPRYNNPAFDGPEYTHEYGIREIKELHEMLGIYLKEFDNRDLD